MTEQKAKEMEDLARQVKPLHGFLVKSGVSAVDAWDILQDSFIKVFHRRNTLPECPEQRKAILFGEVNVQMKAHFTEQTRLLDRAARARELVVFMGLTEQRDVSGVLEARQQLESILSQISPEQCQVFTDKVLDDFTIREVAENLGMNANTTKSYWLRALEVLREKLDNLEHRGARGLVVFIIAGVLGLARNASAMVERIRRFFRTIRMARVHHAVGVTSAAMFVLSPPDSSGISVDDASHVNRPQMSVSASGEIPQSQIVPGSTLTEKEAPRAIPSVSDASSRSVPSAIPRKTMPKKSVVRSGPPDYLITAAITALRDGKPERALELLDQYAAMDAKCANSGMVKTLRADAREAMATH